MRQMDKSPLYAAALSEEKQLLLDLSRLEADYQQRRAPILRKLEAVRSVKAAFSPTEPELALDHPQLTASDIAANVHSEAVKDDSSHKGRVTAAAIELLQQHGSMKTADLLARIEALGIVFMAKDKVGSLSVILSKDGRFVADRRIGWSLAQKETPAPVEEGQAS